MVVPMRWRLGGGSAPNLLVRDATATKLQGVPSLSTQQPATRIPYDDLSHADWRGQSLQECLTLRSRMRLSDFDAKSPPPVPDPTTFDFARLTHG
jgi:hypothetical protein